MMNKINRYVWVYLNYDTKRHEAELTMFVSPDMYGQRLTTIPTPHQYKLTRNDVCYNVSSEVLLSEPKAIEIASLMYETEFVIAPKIKMKARR